MILSQKEIKVIYVIYETLNNTGKGCFPNSRAYFQPLHIKIPQLTPMCSVKELIVLCSTVL